MIVDYSKNEYGIASGDQLASLMGEASALRDQQWGKVITYSRKIFIPLTNMCRDECGYCVFVQKPGSPKAKYMTPDEVLEVVAQGQKLGCKEVLFSLGERPELRYPEAQAVLDKLGYARTTDYLRAMCELVMEKSSMLPHVNAGTLFEDEIKMLKPVSASMGMMLENVSKRLTQKGGPHYACPDKVPVQRLRTLERAGAHSVPFTTGILIGIGETWQERIDSLVAINEMHKKFGHIQEVIVQNFRAKPGIAMANHPEPGHEDMLRTLAVARLILDPSISLQAPPNLEDEYADYIDAGLNDWGGVSPLTKDFINPERAWPMVDKLKAVTEEKGYTLQERLAIYPNYMRPSSNYMEKAVAASVHALAREDGLAATQVGL